MHRPYRRLADRGLLGPHVFEELQVGLARYDLAMIAEVLRVEVRLLRFAQEDLRMGLQVAIERRGAALGRAGDHEVGQTHAWITSCSQRPSPLWDGALPVLLSVREQG